MIKNKEVQLISNQMWLATAKLYTIKKWVISVYINWMLRPIFSVDYVDQLDTEWEGMKSHAKSILKSYLQTYSDFYWLAFQLLWFNVTSRGNISFKFLLKKNERNNVHANKMLWRCAFYKKSFLIQNIQKRSIFSHSKEWIFK